MELRELLQNITPPDEAAREQAHRRWAACAKPLGSLGLLETALEDIAALTGDAQAPLLPRAVLVLCADNGVVAQGVAQTDSSVTAAVTRNLAAGRTSVCRMAQAAQCAVVPVDMGVRDFAPQPGVLARRIGNGTGDITQGPALTRAQAEQAVLAGAELVRTQKEKGVRLLATGEMGIGNTTTASAVASVLLGRAPVEMTGRGAGLSDEGLRRKVAAIERAVALSRPAADDPLDVLAKVGGRLHQRRGGAVRGAAVPGGGQGRFGEPCLGRARGHAAAGRAAQKTAHYGGHAPGRGHGSGGGHAAAGHGPRRIYGLLHV